jgi:hypothetical protein
VALVLVLPERWAARAATAGGAVLGLLTLGKALDVGFTEALTRPFDPVHDVALVADGIEFIDSAVGGLAAGAAVTGAVVLSVLVVVLTALAARRLALLAARRRDLATPAVTVAAVAWSTCAVLGLQVGTECPPPPSSTVTAGRDRALQVVAGVRDRAAFEQESSVDAFRGRPGHELLTGLRGKNVVLAFVESYGRSALADPASHRGSRRCLDVGTDRLRAAGFQARSAFLTSPTAGGGSRLAHATLLSGLWVDNDDRYRPVVASDRLTLGGAFRRAGWRTVGVMPGVTRTWPEASFFGLDQVHDARNMGYRGRSYGWATMPDQYALATLAARRAGRPARGTRPGRGPAGLESCPVGPRAADGALGRRRGRVGVPRPAARRGAAGGRVARLRPDPRRLRRCGHLLAGGARLVRRDVRGRRPRRGLPRGPPARAGRHRRGGRARRARHRRGSRPRGAAAHLGLGVAGGSAAGSRRTGVAHGRVPRPLPDRLRPARRSLRSSPPRQQGDVPAERPEQRGQGGREGGDRQTVGEHPGQRGDAATPWVAATSLRENRGGSSARSQGSSTAAATKA